MNLSGEKLLPYSAFNYFKIKPELCLLRFCLLIPFLGFAKIGVYFS